MKTLNKNPLRTPQTDFFCFLTEIFKFFLTENPSGVHPSSVQFFNFFLIFLFCMSISACLHPQDPFSQSDRLNSRLRGELLSPPDQNALRADENSDLLSGSCAFDELFRLWHSFRQLVGHQFQIHFRSRFHRLHITHNRCHRGDHATLTLLGCCLRNSLPAFDFCIRFFLIQLDHAALHGHGIDLKAPQFHGLCVMSSILSALGSPWNMITAVLFLVILVLGMDRKKRKKVA